MTMRFLKNFVWARFCGSALLVANLHCQAAELAAPSGQETVGPTGGGRVVTPVNQIVTPTGLQVDLAGLRPQAIALNPKGDLLAVSGKTAELLILNPETGEIRQRVPLPSDKLVDPPADVVSDHILEPDKQGQVSYTGLIFSPDGRRIYLANVNGSIKVFSVAEKGEVRGLFSMPLPKANAPRREAEIPAGLALSPDGKRLYVVCNLSNRLAELDAESGKVLRTFEVGFAPYDVVLAGKRAFVSNWGGRRPEAGSVTGPGGRGTLVRVDPVKFIASEGSVSVIDLESGRVLREILTGKHASGLALSPNGRHLVVANAASDTLSVIDVRRLEVVETIWSKSSPADLFGASPNALAFDRSGRTLYVCNGTQNALAVVSFRPGRSKFEGLIPTGWFPGAVLYHGARQHLYVANIKGIGPGKKDPKTGVVSGNSHQYFGSVSLIPVPSRKDLDLMTRRVLQNYREPMLRAAMLPPREGQPKRPIPERVGEPSVFRHVVYIIKENRTYDQVFGDVKEGNGEPSLCIFGEEVTPNQHKMVRDFVLLDNTYCSGILSADGHQWSSTSFATDYMEKSFAGFPRSYPDGMEDDDIDALAYAPSGFIWDNALAHGRTVRDYGEFAITESFWKDSKRKEPLKFLDYYHDFVNQTGLIQIYSRPAVESLSNCLCTNTVGWDMDIPDQFRAAQFIKELKEYEKTGAFPNLVIICLPNDHTSGTSAGSPTPAAQVADNDLAFGKIVEAISHSPFWKETCIFAIEDDPQAGWDHVSGYRTTAYVISPYTKRKQVVSTQYNHTSIIRTFELILGLPPMNIMDATGTPMTDCFTDQPDFTPFTAVPSRVPLDQMNPDPKKIADPLLRRHALASAKLPLQKPDQCSESLLNLILWHAMKGSAVPYPQWAAGRDDDDD